MNILAGIALAGFVGYNTYRLQKDVHIGEKEKVAQNFHSN